MSKYEYLYHVELSDKYEPQKKSSRDIWAPNKTAIKKEYQRTDRIDYCEKVLDESGKPKKRLIGGIE